METRTCDPTALFRRSLEIAASRRFRLAFQASVIRGRLSLCLLPKALSSRGRAIALCTTAHRYERSNRIGLFSGECVKRRAGFRCGYPDVSTGERQMRYLIIVLWMLSG